jgi:hypothetical protein
MAKPMTKTEWMNWLEKAWDEAQQREWVGLTDEEIDAAWRSVDYTVDYYYCVICGKFIEAVDGVIVHDDIPHPPLMDFDEESNPQ